MVIEFAPSTGSRLPRPGRIGAALLALALGAGCGSGAGSPPGGGGPPPPVVEVGEVGRLTLDEGLQLVGQLEPWESVMLRAETDGVIESVEFDEGQDVAKGAPLFRLRDGEQQARVREAEAQVKLAGQAFTRSRSLAGREILAAADLDQATAARDAAQARLDLARVALERMTIRAPFDGVLGARLVSPGDRVNDMVDLVQIDAVTRLRLAFPVPEPIVEWVKVGMPLSVAVSPYPGQTFPGAIYFVAPSLDPRSRQLLLKGEVPNAERRLRPGMFANVRLETERHEAAITAPESAVVFDSDGTFVYRVATDGTAQRVGVELGIRRDGKVEVLKGLEDGDRVVVAGTNKVVPGRAIQVAETRAPEKSAGPGT